MSFVNQTTGALRLSHEAQSYVNSVRGLPLEPQREIVAYSLDQFEHYGYKNHGGISFDLKLGSNFHSQSPPYLCDQTYFGLQNVKVIFQVQTDRLFRVLEELGHHYQSRVNQFEMKCFGNNFIHSQKKIIHVKKSPNFENGIYIFDKANPKVDISSDLFIGSVENTDFGGVALKSNTIRSLQIDAKVWNASFKRLDKLEEIVFCQRVEDLGSLQSVPNTLRKLIFQGGLSLFNVFTPMLSTFPELPKCYERSSELGMYP
ncbi:unnamed protein product [Ambrosiozyma monospora]|uniref:Unnamed protein product n=1 Tax=Ambrosiozyma monospora TaxID=43982 RepID=A0ACB5TJE9_AMBMO|nr:unnamed protein product [Ambrosiozyma monospora]